MADAEEIQVTDDEYGNEIVQRASRAGVAPKEYYDQIVRAGMAASVYTDVRRNKAMGRVLERVTITDTDGERGRRGLTGRADDERRSRPRLPGALPAADRVDGACARATEPADPDTRRVRTARVRPERNPPPSRLAT